ncbi:MAG: HDOD domain-containing protein [Proteobacteria bacterium]|nr:HDOD domain-containing protein [Pseudomonadota bacterium]
MSKPKSARWWLSIDKEHRMVAVMESVTEVASIPATAQEVLQLTSNRNTSAQPIVEAVLKDPAFAAEILRVANSPWYGQTRKIDDLHRAIVIIGMLEIHNIAAGMAMLAAFSSDDRLSEELRASSVLSASLSTLVAQEIGGIESTIAFLAGLLCEIGTMALLSIDSGGYMEIWNSAQGVPEMRAHLEKERYGATSEKIGSELLLRNKIPEEVCQALQASLTTPLSELATLARLTIFSRLAAPLLIRAANEDRPEILMRDIIALAERFGFGSIDKSRLIEICIQAGTTAELSLRGEISLLDQVEQTEQEPGEQDDAVPEEKTSLEPEEPIPQNELPSALNDDLDNEPAKPRNRSLALVLVGLGIAVIAAAAAIGAVWIFLL